MAIWELIGSGRIHPAGEVQTWKPQLGWTTVQPGSGGARGGLNLGALASPYPSRLFWPRRWSESDVMTDGDLYLSQIRPDDLHPGISEAIRESLRCFRADLFTGAVATLGAAVEGLWSDTVREARNVLHWGTDPTLANDFDKVATLLVAGARHIQVLWRVRQAASSA